LDLWCHQSPEITHRDAKKIRGETELTAHFLQFSLIKLHKIYAKELLSSQATGTLERTHARRPTKEAVVTFNTFAMFMGSVCWPGTAFKLFLIRDML